jgi:hypothetical protein
MRSQVFLACTALCALSVGPSMSFAALASKATGKAQTSSTTSSSPTAKAQANLMDPAAGDSIVTFARLDIDIHYDNLPPTLQAFNIISGITVSGFDNTDLSDPNHQADQTGYAFIAAGPDDEGDTALPSYSFDPSHQDSNIVFDGSNVFIHDIAVEVDPGKALPLVGDVNMAEVHVQYFNFDSFGGINYNDIIATFTTTVDSSDDEFPGSEIDAVNPDDPNDVTFFGPDDIIPSSSTQTLGGQDVPEPAMLSLLALLPLMSRKMRKCNA